MMRRAEAAIASPDTLVLEDAEGLTGGDVERFWSDLLPLFRGAMRQSFDTLPDAVQALHARFDRRERRAQARLLGRYAACLVARFEPLYLYRGHSPLLSVPTYFHLWMLAHHVIGCGPEAYHQDFEEPLRAREHVRNLTPETGLYALGLFRYDAFRFEAQKLRLIQAFTYPHDRESKLSLARRLRTRDFAALPAAERFAFRVAFRVSGYFHVLSALRDAFRGPRFEGEHPERYPSFVEDESGEIRSRDPSEPADSRPTTR
jgi:hypothetical protein